MKKSAMTFALALLLTGLAAPAASAAESVTVIPHTEVVGFAEVEPVSRDQQLAKQFQPFLEVRTGCVPFPAVDAAGNVSGGLAPTGGSSSGCNSHTGQVYARSGWHNGAYAIMYSWYFPKDSPSPGLGHRHDWEGLVVWLDDPAAVNPQIASISYFQHGNYRHTPATEDNTHQGRPLMAYYHTWPVNHTLWVSSRVGGQQPLIAWEDMTPEARRALEVHDFGAANVPFNDARFSSHLERAWYQ